MKVGYGHYAMIVEPIVAGDNMYEYKAEFVRVIDGDTVVFNIDLGFSTWVKDEHVRFAYVNAPESRTRDLVEKEKGLAAKAFVQEQINRCLGEGGNITLKTYKDHGKFGRFIAEIKLNYLDGVTVNLNNLLVETGHALYVKY